jgi:molybdopterin-guanine dinucleotide biosynthesis protein A
METRPLPTLSAVILAGGASSRMGQDKASLSYQGSPLLRRVYDLAREMADPVYVVTPWRDRYQSILTDNNLWINEPLPTQGPLWGFALAIPRLTTEWILLLPCDLPLLSADLLGDGHAQLAAVEPRAIAFLPRQAKGWEPFCGFYRRACFADLQAYLASDGRSFQGWLAQQTVTQWQMNNSNALFNCNTVRDWQILNETENLTHNQAKN